MGEPSILQRKSQKLKELTRLFCTTLCTITIVNNEYYITHRGYAVFCGVAGKDYLGESRNFGAESTAILTCTGCLYNAKLTKLIGDIPGFGYYRFCPFYLMIISYTFRSVIASGKEKIVLRNLFPSGCIA
jgi:hypothetical protein